MDKQKLVKWNRWINRIEGDLIRLLASRKIYKGYGDIVRTNSAIQADGITFNNWVVDNYVTFAAMAVRRQIDTDNDSISLARLITDICDNPQSLTRAMHVALYTNMPSDFGKELADKWFTESAGKGDFIDPAIAEADLKALRDAGEKIGRLATRKIAHSSTKVVPTMTFDEVDECIEVIKKITQKYIFLLSAVHNVLEPTMPDWQRVFTYTWIPSNNDTVIRRSFNSAHKETKE